MNHRWRWSLIWLSIAAVAFMSLPWSAQAAQDEMQSYLAANATQGTIPPGTRITAQNWRQYRQFMPLGMIDLFEGKYDWKMPADVEMVVGPTIPHPAPPSYRDATEKYSGQVRIVRLPNGGLNIEDYVGGMPFPNPQAPHKGWKILVDEWFPPAPHIFVQAEGMGEKNNQSSEIYFCTQDSYHNQACAVNDLVYMALNFNSDPGVPRALPGAGDYYLSEWLMVEQPEESKYTADLTLFPNDFTKFPYDFVFVPALRRTVQLSTTARCAPLFGSDMTHDDQKTGFNGGFTNFRAKWLGDRKILGITELTYAAGAFPTNFDMPLGWAKPSWGDWTLRDTQIIDVRRIPSMAAGYCYGKRILYVDKQISAPVWVDLYDSNMKLWKVVADSKGPLTDPASGQTYGWGNYIETYWDVQNSHASYVFGQNGRGGHLLINGMAPPQYSNVTRYATPGGLMQIMR